MEERDNPRCEYVGLGDYQAVLVRRKRLIGVIVGAAFVSSIVVGLLLPKQYSATARVLPPAPDDPGAASSLLSRAPGGLGGNIRMDRHAAIAAFLMFMVWRLASKYQNTLR